MFPVLEFLNNLWGLGNQIGIGLSYRAAHLHRLAESIPLNRFLGSLKVYKFGLRTLLLCKEIGEIEDRSSCTRHFKGPVPGQIRSG
jgi:hypothetical protein